METVSIMMICIPFFMPIVRMVGFDPVWFGIVITLLVEIALVTPPLGFNCFVLNQMVDDVELLDVFVGTTPFVVLALLSIAIITAVPGIVLWLPSTMF